MDQAELKKRTKQFGLRAMKMIGALPNDSVGRAIHHQREVAKVNSLLEIANRKSTIEDRQC